MYFLSANVDLFSIAWWGFILGGLGIFLLGLTSLGEGLKKIAGQKLKSLIDRFTSTPLKGVLVGAFATVLMQSSSATTAMTIGLVKAGLMSFVQSIGIIMGANIGTTITAFIIGLKISTIAPFILLIGSFMYLFSRRQSARHVGEAIFGFGAIFFGLYLMEFSLKSLSSFPAFVSLIENLEGNPLLGVLIGAVGSAAVQSSSAFIGILQGLAATTEGFTLTVALPMLFGSNIGTTVTAVLASFGSSKSAKRAALIHIIFNVFGTILFMLILRPYARGLDNLFDWMHVNPRMEIAIAHIIFNVTTVVILIPFVVVLAKLAHKIIPEGVGEFVDEVDLHELERDVVEIAPSAALEIARKQVVTMGHFAASGVSSVRKFVLDGEIAEHDHVLACEEAVDRIYEKLSDFLNSMRRTVLEERDVLIYSELLHVMKDIERISDHNENLIEYFDESLNRGEKINDEAKRDILHMLSVAQLMVEKSVLAFEKTDLNLAQEVIKEDDELDNLNRSYRLNHIERFRGGSAENNRYIAMVFVDILANIERIGDHCVNIADAIVDLLENR